MHAEDPFDSLSPSVFGSHPPADGEQHPALPDVVAADIRFVGLTRTRAHACSEDGRVPAGAGFFTADGALDLCPICFRLARERPHHAPSPDEQIRFARAGIGTGDAPWVIDVRTDTDLAALIDVLDAHDVRRIVVRTTRAAPEDARIFVASATMPAQSQSGPLRSFELQLQGLAFGPPMDPELVAAMEAATDEHGVIRDAELADRYFEALVAQQAAMNELLGTPEPVIEHGPVFPSFADDDEPLPS
jgi:hypothetical protein